MISNNCLNYPVLYRGVCALRLILLCDLSAVAGSREHHRLLQPSPAARSQFAGGRCHYQVINYTLILCYFFVGKDLRLAYCCPGPDSDKHLPSSRPHQKQSQLLAFFSHFRPPSCPLDRFLQLMNTQFSL